MDNYIAIGTTKKPFGVQGELKVEVDDAFLEDFLRAKVLFVNTKGKPVPYFVEAISEKSATLVKFEDINSKEAANQIGGQQLFLRSQDIIPEDDRQLIVEASLAYGRLVKFQILDQELGAIGTIDEIVEFPQQEMAVVNYRQKEVLIPLNEALIVSIDQDERVVHMRLPEGLLDI